MRSMKGIIQVATITFVFILGTPAGYACWCFKPDVKEAFDNAKVVFVGEVVEVIPPRSTDRNAKFVDAAHTVKFKAATVWKKLFLTEANVLVRMGGGCSLSAVPHPHIRTTT